MAIAITGNGATSYTAVRTSITLTIPGGAGSGGLMIAVCYESENTRAGTWDDDAKWVYTKSRGDCVKIRNRL